MSIRHYLQFSDFSAGEYAYLLKRAAIIKRKFKAYEKYHPLADRTLAMIFEKASTRTRVSFEAGMYQLGGSVVHLTTGDSQLGRSEPIEDTARVISRMVDIVMIRTFEQERIEKFAQHSRVPVINGLTNEYHPCQILADIFTFIEHRGSIEGKTVTWIGDGNNMANTWAQAAALLGFELRVSSPHGYEVDTTLAELDGGGRRWQDFENALRSEDGYTDTAAGRKHYSELADFDSMVSYWLVMEIMGNQDAGALTDAHEQAVADGIDCGAGADGCQCSGADVLTNGDGVNHVVQLRENGITLPILILGFTPAFMAKTLADNNISQAVFSQEYAKELSIPTVPAFPASRRPQSRYAAEAAPRPLSRR